MMRFSVLGSGSAGNAVLFGDRNEDYWLFDVGLSAKQITNRLAQLEVCPSKIKGIFLSHEHRDHVSGLPVFLKKHPTPVYTTELTREYLTSQLKFEADWNSFEAGQDFSVDSLSMKALRVPHDATDPVGYIFENQGRKAAVITDLGYVSDSLAESLKGVEMMYLESNYDPDLLEQDRKRPWSIKQRISSRHGHLSNLQASELIKQLQPHGLHKVALGHLSKDCNHPECIIDLMEKLPVGIDFEISSQKEVTQWLELDDEQNEYADESWKQLSLF